MDEVFCVACVDGYSTGVEGFAPVTAAMLPLDAMCSDCHDLLDDGYRRGVHEGWREVDTRQADFDEVNSAALRELPESNVLGQDPAVLAEERLRLQDLDAKFDRLVASKSEAAMREKRRPKYEDYCETPAVHDEAAITRETLVEAILSAQYD
jgi:hypothetical protein